MTDQSNEIETRKTCLAAWPAAQAGEYNPSCCRFPKSCSCPPPEQLSRTDEILAEVKRDVRTNQIQSARVQAYLDTAEHALMTAHDLARFQSSKKHLREALDAVRTTHHAEAR